MRTTSMGLTSNGRVAIAPHGSSAGALARHRFSGAGPRLSGMCLARVEGVGRKRSAVSGSASGRGLSQQAGPSRS